MNRFLYIIIATAVLMACNDNRPVTDADGRPPIYPDYTDVTLPVNVAPLNFLARDSAQGVWVLVDGVTLAKSGDNRAVFDIDRWRQLLAEHSGKAMNVEIRTLHGQQWIAYHTTWTVVPDSIDPYLTYRLIEPDYEVYHHLALYERCVENFEERPISIHQLVGDRCMNCHTYAGQSPQRSMMYVRGEGGGAILNDAGTLSKLDIKAPGMVSGSVYFGFSPSGRYITFSTNVIIPAFHSRAAKRLEVYDDKSDVYVADLKTRRIISSPLLADSMHLETFPTFAPDGRHIYYCVARTVELPGQVEQLQYSLCRIGFDESTGTIGNRVDTIVGPTTSGPSPDKRLVSHPRVSPDGRYVLYTVAHYGTFPIWHTEADLQMLDLTTGAVDTLAVVNSPKSDTYHAWSSNGRWFVFASKRDDGLYGKPYFCYIDKDGRPHKPFVLPQRDPAYYDNCLRSFNAPELGRAPLPFDAHDVARAMHTPALPFK